MKYTEILRADGGVVSRIHHDSADPDRFHHILTEDLQPIIDDCKTWGENLGNTRKMDWKPVAQIPVSVVNRMKQDGSWNDKKALKKWLNDPANDCFRITKGQV